MLTMRIRPKTSVNPLASKKSNPANVTPFRVWISRPCMRLVSRRCRLRLRPNVANAGGFHRGLALCPAEHAAPFRGRETPVIIHDPASGDGHGGVPILAYDRDVGVGAGLNPTFRGQSQHSRARKRALEDEIFEG